MIRKKGLHHPRLDGAAAAAVKGQTEELGGKKTKTKNPPKNRGLTSILRITDRM